MRSAPHPHLGTEGLSVTRPEASPGLGTVWPLSPGPGSHLGLSPCNWCQGKRETGVQGRWPGPVGWGDAEGEGPFESCRRGQADPQPGLPSCPGESLEFSAYLPSPPPGHTPASPAIPAGAREAGSSGGRRSQTERKLTLAPRPPCAPQERAGLLEC